jgi:rod shape-determining protein MreC
MARTTPTHTPALKYILACLVSMALLFSDVNYQTLSPLRGSVQAVGIYSQLFFATTVSRFLEFTSAYENQRTLTRLNNQLRDELQEIDSKLFLQKQSQLITKDMINLQDRLQILGDQRDGKVLKIASFGLQDYLCCSQHILHLQNPLQFAILMHQPVAVDKTFIGQTSKTHLNLIEVTLFSDSSHILPVKIDGLHCNARGAGKPRLVRCLASEEFKMSDIQEGSLVLTSGLGGVFPKDVIIGKVLSIYEISNNELRIDIALDGNPLDHNYFGILSGS